MIKQAHGVWTKAQFLVQGCNKKCEYVYDEYYNCILCPANQVLRYPNTTGEGHREYKSNPVICRNCPKWMQCTHSKSTQKVVTCHIYTLQYNAICRFHKETSQRVFGGAKEKYGVCCPQLGGLLKVKM